MQYAVKVNSFVRDVNNHHFPCGQIRKRGRGPGQYGQVLWQDFATLGEAEGFAKKWELSGYKKGFCRICLKKY
jgi:hypothetical protein